MAWLRERRLRRLSTLSSRLWLPVTSSTCHFRPFPNAAGLGMVGRITWACVLRPAQGISKVKYNARRRAPPFKHEVHLPLSNKLGRWQRGPRAVGFSSEYPSPRWVADQGWRASPAQGFIYRSSPLLGQQPSMTNKPHPPRASLVILRQAHAFVLSFWLESRGHHVEIGVGFEVCATQDVLGPFMRLIHN